MCSQQSNAYLSPVPASNSQRIPKSRAGQPVYSKPQMKLHAGCAWPARPGFCSTIAASLARTSDQEQRDLSLILWIPQSMPMPLAEMKAWRNGSREIVSDGQ